MKILLLNYEYPPLGGGAGVISRYITEGLSEKGHQLCVITTWFKGEQEHTAPADGRAEIIRLRSKRKLAYRSNIQEMISWMRHCRHFLTMHLENNQYDLVFANFALPGGAVARQTKRQYNIPYVILSHGHDIPWFYPRQMFVYHLLTYFRIRRICRASSGLFLQSADMMHNAQRFLGKESQTKLFLIPNGTDYKMFFPDQGTRSGEFTILFAGRLVKQKGPMLFMEALKILKRKGIAFHVRIVGDGKMRSAMEDFVRTNDLGEAVRFLGWISKEEIAQEYRTAHLLVAPSLNEGMSMVINEALASGLYVLASPVSCNTTLIRQGLNGEICTEANSDKLAEQMADYFHDKFTRGYTVPKEEIDRFREEYEWEGIVTQYEKTLEAILTP